MYVQESVCISDYSISVSIIRFQSHHTIVIFIYVTPFHLTQLSLQTLCCLQSERGVCLLPCHDQLQDCGPHQLQDWAVTCVQGRDLTLLAPPLWEGIVVAWSDLETERNILISNYEYIFMGRTIVKKSIQNYFNNYKQIQ